MNYKWTYVLLVFSILMSVSESFNRNSAVVKVKLIDYYNPSSLLYNGDKCETFHWTNDKCDARIDIEVYNKDDLISRYRSDSFENFNYIYSIGQFNIRVDKLPIKLRLVINIHDIDYNRDQFIMMNKVVVVTLGDKLQKMVKIANAHTSMTVVFNLPFLPKKVTKKFPMIAKHVNLKPLYSFKPAKNESVTKPMRPSVILMITASVLLMVILVVIIAVVIRRNRTLARQHSTLVQYIRETDNAHISSLSLTSRNNKKLPEKCNVYDVDEDEYD